MHRCFSLAPSSFFTNFGPNPNFQFIFFLVLLWSLKLPDSTSLWFSWLYHISFFSWWIMRAFFWASNSTPSLISTFLAPDVIILFRGPWLAANFFYWFHLYCVFKKYYIYIIPSLLLLSTVVFSLAPHTGNALGVHRPPHVHFNLNNFNIHTHKHVTMIWSTCYSALLICKSMHEDCSRK